LCPSCGTKFLVETIPPGKSTPGKYALKFIPTYIIRDGAYSFRPDRIVDDEFTFDNYQQWLAKFAKYPSRDTGNISYPALGLSGEAGEYIEKFMDFMNLTISVSRISELAKKALRDSGGDPEEAAKEEVVKEAGDVLWYLARTLHEIGVSLSLAAKTNILKLEDRLKRNQIHGSGDNR
jgi:NTP pyrophosphatase (non-canonical NTP hydrolase)